ncbi:MAG: hypothetical protein J7M10_06585, partial [Candidatus Cloacimonetes bacterium]|nr:hypothetical protein [Candidatus Cloacimonadota bacterium]
MLKKISFITIFLLLFINCFAEEITLEKIVEYPTSGLYLEKDNLCVQEQYLFVASSYGLEIYEVEPDTPAQLISRLPLRDDARVVEVKDNYAYVQAVSYYEHHTNLYKIDISDVMNPSVVDSVFTDNEDGFGQGDIYNDFIIFRNWDEGLNFYYSIYRIPEFEFVQNYYCSHWFMQLNDTLAFYMCGGNVFPLYDFSDPENITEIGQVNFNDSGIDIENIQSVNDSIVACMGEDGIAFWNYSDNRNWQYLSTIYSPSDENWSHKLYAVDDLIFVTYVSNTPGMKSINISNVYLPYVVDSMPLTQYWLFITSFAIDGALNSVVIGTLQKIHQYVFDNGYFEEQFDIYENFLQHGGVIYNNYLYISFACGLKIYDISSLPDVVHINTIYEDHQISELQIVENLLFFIDYTDYAIIVLDLSNPTAPVIRNEIYIPVSRGNILLKNTADCLFYKEDYPVNVLYKYSIPEPGNYILDFQYDLNCDGNGFIYNEHFYYLASENPNGPDLQIFGGLENNDPELVMTIEDFASGYPEYPRTFINNCDNYLYLTSYGDPCGEPFDSTRFFEIESPTQISYKFTANHSGLFSIKDDYLYVSGTFSHIYIYDLVTASGIFDPIAHYQDYGASLDCILNEFNGTKYLYHFQSTAFSIYEINDFGVQDEYHPFNPYFNNYPNPFSTSTTISFSTASLRYATPRQAENAEIKIYNIKG